MWSWRLIVGVLLPVLFALVAAFLYKADQKVQSRLARGWFLPPIEFFTAPQSFQVGQTTSPETWADRFRRWGWRERQSGQPVLEGDFILLPGHLCREELPKLDWLEEFTSCLGFWEPGQSGGRWLTFVDDQIRGTYSLTGKETDRVRIPGERFAQYYQDQPILRTVVDLGAVPLYCAQAVTAIEDADFLTHRGISFSGIARAMARNLSKARFAEGASTITQQLVKNYFLTSEKTLRRKITEQAMAILLELRVDKDEILASYLNVIYMGQQGSFQVRGLAAASEHYFGKNLSALKLSECALLAAIINNPGRYNPLRHPESARQRRSLVLNRMEQLNMISAEQREQSDLEPLGARSKPLLSEPAPYFVQAVLDEIRQMGLSAEQGLKIHTTLDPDLQEQAQVVVAQELEALEKRHANIRAHSVVSPLQGAAIIAHVESGGVRALVGGRQYKQNQFNRIRSSRRQPGSLFKPFVYLAALENGDFSPDTELIDEPWTYRYEGQTWTPRNYDKHFRGRVTMMQALANSLNVPTARLAVEIGIPTLIEVAHRLGIKSELEPLPALSLGAAEVTPWELTEAYLTLAKDGWQVPLHLFTKIEDGAGEILFEFDIEPRAVAREETVRTLITMMKRTFVDGTAYGIGRLITEVLQTEDAPAGKTGTTSDTRDAWFAGFDRSLLTLTWVGFDDNASTGLTGSSAALPIWYRLQYRR